jgi:hypothetical protein
MWYIGAHYILLAKFKETKKKIQLPFPLPTLPSLPSAWESLKLCGGGIRETTDIA